MQLGTISIARDGTVLDLNPEARRIVEQRDGLLLSANHLSTEGATERRELQRVLRLALLDEKDEGPAVIDAVSVTRPSGQAQLGLVIRRVPQGLGQIGRASCRDGGCQAGGIW